MKMSTVYFNWQVRAGKREYTVDYKKGFQLGLLLPPLPPTPPCMIGVTKQFPGQLGGR